MDSTPPPMTAREKADIEKRFGRYINQGQVRYLKAGHLDVLESERLGVGFVDPVSGRRMFDCFTSAGSFNVSRHNPEVLAALTEAAGAMDMGAICSPGRMQHALAGKLAGLAPDGIDRVRLAAGGGDAVEAAIKMAIGATKRRKVVSTVKAYHGHTGFALSANGKAHYREYCEPLMPGFSFVPFNDLEAMEDAADTDTAAIIVEPVQGEAGIYPAEVGYLRGLRKLCDQRGIVLILDEIQTGFGRTGRMFACEHSGICPDVMTAAKSLGGGFYPIAAMMYADRPLLTEFVEKHPRFHTSPGGTDLGCAVGLAVIDYLESNRLWENAAAMGKRFRGGLEELRRDNPALIAEVRGVGLMVGIEYVHEFMGPMMSEALAREGVFAAYSGNAPQVMRFMMPITASEAEVDAVLAAVARALKRMKGMLPAAMLAAKVPGVLSLLNSERMQTAAFGLLRKVEDALGGPPKGKR